MYGTIARLRLKPGMEARLRKLLGDAAPAVAAVGRVLTSEQALAEAEMVLELNCDEGADAPPAPCGGQ